MTRSTGIFLALLLPILALGQGGDQQVRAKADQLFTEQRFAEAMPLYSQLVSLTPSDRTLNYRFGACLLFGSADKEQAVGHLKFATEAPDTDPVAWYWLGRAYHLNYRFKEAQVAYQRFLGTADKKLLAQWPVEALQKQCRNGEKLLSNLKEITVRSKVEVADADFFRFYELADIGGRLVVLPDEIKTSLDKKRKHRSLVYLPQRNGPIYFSSFGKDGTTGLDIYRTELLPDGTYAAPVKLAGYINTDQDEDFPFMHPDGKTFYFCSKGHNSMGGYDVFRASYDRGLEAFGRPENLDFAISTPDDDILYIVDAEQKEACFASGRNSKQGMLHVYRVGTAQAPVMITAFKGTYASTIDKEDRKARIVVEDMLTQEQVADARTDINGNYVLSVPRAGRYRYRVECGPTGKTHGGVVEVPKADGPRAYRQELILDRKGDLEQLTIRNYFDEPLSEDMVALALEEIKRRARLDVSTREVVAQQPAPSEPQPERDLLTRAGFTGDVDEVKAVQLAKEDARELEAQAMDQQAMAAEAFALALDAATEADKAAAKADELIERAASAGDDEAQRNALMTEAAVQRQRAREATLRARAAHNTGTALAASSLATRQKSAEASKLSNDLAAAIAAKQEDRALTQLQALKKRLDEKSKTDPSSEPAEQARRQLAEQEKEAARQMAIAKSKRDEENEVADQLARLKRERDEARSKPKKEEAERRLAELEQQQRYLREETLAAVRKAEAAERQTAIARGQASLTRHLAQTSERGAGSELSPDQVQQLGLRISGADQRAAALAIDERYDAMAITERTQAEARAFDWDLVSAAQAIGEQRTATQVMERNGANDAQRAAARQVDAPQGAADERSLRQANVEQPPATAGREEQPAERSSEQIAANGGRAAAASGEDRTASPAGAGSSVAETAVPVSSQAPETRGNAAQAGNAVRSGNAAQPGGAGQNANAAQASNAAQTGNAAQQGAASLPGTEQTASNQAGTNVSARSTAGTEASRPIAAKGGEANSPDETVAITADQRFVLENERAELAQLASAERDRAKREQLQQRIEAIDQRLAQADASAGAPENEPEVEADMSRPIASFTPAAKDDEIVAQLYRDYAADLKRAERMTDADARADAINGIELMLADSLRAEMQRQVAVLQLAPQQAEEVLPRVDRLRRLREEHLARGEQALAQRQAELAGVDAAPAAVRDGDRTVAAANDRINERYVAIDRYARNVYASKLEHRSRAKGVDDAIAFLQADRARIEDLSARIDSIEKQLSGMPLGKESDKLRKKADQLIDERYIIRTDLGQRSAFLMREEWKAATDSLRKMEAATARKGLSLDEPLVLMVKEYGTESKGLFDGAAQLRKRADRSEDIVLRDSLYRRAYRDELRALQAMDRAITVQNHLAGDGHKRGEQLTYEEVAARVLGLDARPLVAQRTGADARPDEARMEGEVPPTRASESARDAQGQRDTAAGAEAGQAAQVNRTAAAEQAVQRDAQSDRSITEVSAQRPDESAPAAAAQGARASTGAPSTGAARLVDAARSASPAAEQSIAQAESRLKEQDKVPARLYERFLAGESAVLQPGALEPDSDPDLLAIRSESKSREAEDLEQRSQQAADRANALADSASSARRRDRERLTALSVRERALSDSLHGASVKTATEAAALRSMSLEAEKAAKLRDRLVKYYYLTPEEQRLTLLDGDASRFFQAKALAMDQLQAAEDASGAARSNREVASVLREQARAAERDAINGRIPAGEATSKAILLDARAVQLELRADSLENVASRLRGAASINEAQAGVMLQAMPAERSSELMALEQRARRTEALLAQSRDQAAPARDQAAVRLDRPTIRPAQSGQANAGAAVATDQPAVRATDSGEPAARPEGGQAAAEAARPAEGISTAPMADQPRGVDVLPFRMPDELVEDMFTLNAPTARREAPIPMDVELPSGIVFKVQIGAFRNQVPQEAFSDMTPVMGESVGNGLVRYTAGLFTGFDGAAAAKDLVRERGYRDAFVVAYRDGKRIPLGEAMRATQPANAVAAAQSPIRVRGSQEEPAPRIVESAVPAAPPAIVIKQPVVADRPAAEAEDAAAILARYPASAQQILETFAPTTEAVAYYDVPGAAPARQVETIKGLFFTVQVGVYSRPVPLDKLFNITPLNSELTESAKVRYTTGRYSDLDGARSRKDEAVGLGVKDAFITAYLNGKRIPVREATALLQQFGPAILAQP